MLGSAVDPVLRDGQPHPIHRWLTGTIESDFPGLPQGLTAYFRAPKAGDLVVVKIRERPELWLWGHRRWRK